MPKVPDDPQLDLTDCWLAGDEPSYVWFAYGDPDLRAQYQDGTKQAAATLAKIYMIRNLFIDLAGGQVIALGIEVSPSTGRGPEIVPQYLFASPPPHDWDQTTISGFGRTFSGLKLLTLEKFSDFLNRPSTEPPAAPQAEPLKELAPPASPESSAPTAAAALVKLGRTDSWPWSEQALKELFRRHPELEGASASAIQSDYDDVFRELFPKLKKAMGPPRERTLREHLKQYRSAKAGKSRQE